MFFHFASLSPFFQRSNQNVLVGSISSLLLHKKLKHCDFSAQNCIIEWKPAANFEPFGLFPVHTRDNQPIQNEEICWQAHWTKKFQGRDRMTMLQPQP
jgi:hypothetical protein